MSEGRHGRVGKYIMHEVLGEGSFAKVRRAVHSETGEKVAIKILQKERLIKEKLFESVKEEIRIMKLVNHPNVVNLKENLLGADHIYLVMEFAAGGELFYKLVDAERFSEDTSRRYFRQLIYGVEYCHLMGIAHRDLKPENLLLDAHDNVKISDFGLAGLQEHGTLMDTMCGTPSYVAPEVLLSKKYDGMKSDIWSCGVILYVFLCGALPFDDDDTQKLYRQITRAQPVYPPYVTPSAKDLISLILNPNPQTRYTIAQIKTHPWFTHGGYVPPENKVEPIPAASPASPEPAELVETIETPRVTPTMNAFELISLSGALDIGRLFRPATADSDAMRVTSFASDREPQYIYTRVKEELGKIEKAKLTVDPKSFEVIVSFSTRMGLIDASVKIYQVGSAHMVNVIRKGGDLMTFYKFFIQLRKSLDDIKKVAPKTSE